MGLVSDTDAVDEGSSAGVSLVVPPRLTVRITGGPSAGQSLCSEGLFCLTVGRTARSRLHLKDPSVSERHAEICWDGRSWVVSDLGSSNGTLAQGVKLSAPGCSGSVASLAHGDVLSFGTDTIAIIQLESQTLANLTVEQLVRSQYEALAQNILVSPAVNKDSGISEEVHEG
ncbi:MAG: hypothetical protein WDW38_009817 [Sanguina aurantia]